MDTRAILEELLSLLDLSGVQIRREAMGGGGGGMCVIKERKIFFMDIDCPVIEMTVIASHSVNELLDIESIYIRPQVRQYLEKYAETPSAP
jgi:hypothetical protein